MKPLITLASRLAALALAGGIGALIVLGGVVPFTERLAGLDEEVRSAAVAVERLRSRIGDRDGFADRIAELEREIAESDVHVSAETPAIGAAVMQRLLADAAGRAGIQVASVQVLPGKPEAGFRRIALRTELSGPFPGVVALLHDLESGRPYIFIDSLDMRTHTVPTGAEQGDDPTLSVRADLSAYMRESGG